MKKVLFILLAFAGVMGASLQASTFLDTESVDLKVSIENLFNEDVVINQNVVELGDLENFVIKFSVAETFIDDLNFNLNIVKSDSGDLYSQVNRIRFNEAIRQDLIDIQVKTMYPVSQNKYLSNKTIKQLKVSKESIRTNIKAGTYLKTIQEQGILLFDTIRV